MVTALFADIKGAMELMEDLDPEKARARGFRAEDIYLLSAICCAALAAAS
jgi:hypothetical protein